MAVIIAFAVFACILAAITLSYWPSLFGRKEHASLSQNRLPDLSSKNAIQIEPVRDFDWQSTEPLKFRPFKPIYHITMEFIVIDSNYLSRIKLRQDIMANHRNHVVGCIPFGVAAVRELRSYLLGDYLPSRYPTLFTTNEKTFHNHVTNASMPLSPPEDPVEALKQLGQTVEDDMFLLHGTPEGHRCVAMVCCFPSGFDPAEKLGKLLKDIHGPVPSYDKIEQSMERYFAKLEVGKNVKRLNWAISTHSELFNLATNHVKQGDTVEQDADVDISKTKLRMELQTLTRLPQTGAILFSFKTFMCPIEDIKAEGLGPQLADAIEGLKCGNAPGMWTYKGGVRWGKSVCEYLRS